MALCELAHFTLKKTQIKVLLLKKKILNALIFQAATELHVLCLKFLLFFMLDFLKSCRIRYYGPSVSLACQPSCQTLLDALGLNCLPCEPSAFRDKGYMS